MTIIYVFYGFLWLIMMACSWRDLLRIQYFIGLVIILGFIEKVFFYAEYKHVDTYGNTSGSKFLLLELSFFLNPSRRQFIVCTFLRPRNYRFYSNGSFCKGTWVRKILAGAKSRRLCGTSFFSYACNGKLLCFGCFAAGLLVNGCFFLMHYHIYNWLSNAGALKTCGWIAMSMLNFDNGVNFFSFLRVSSGCFV